MPSYNLNQHAQPSPVRNSRQPFAFPSNHHLLVTTPKNVFSWDREGLREIFSSASKGVLAARESKDGTGLLAIADSQVVVFHDPNRDKDNSYRLQGTDGIVRLLEYSDDSKHLFFTTTLQNAVQTYSISKACLLDPTHIHPSPPTVLATSKTSHLLITASENPPTAYLQNITLFTPPVLMRVQASSSAVVYAAFHPERPNVFLLAFRDGTLAAYDAIKILRDSDKSKVAARSKVKTLGEIGHFKKLHAVIAGVRRNCPPARAMSSDVPSTSVSITGAAFLPGYKTRAVSAGADGKCRIVDFELGGKVLRTWHAQGPVTSLSLFGAKNKERNYASPAAIIAVGRQDGKVLLFDSLGLLLAEQTVDVDGCRVISIDWMKGSGPEPLGANERVRFAPDTIINVPSLDRKMIRKSGGATRSGSWDAHDDTETSTNDPPDSTSNDEIPSEDSGTVNYTPIAGAVSRNVPDVMGSNYMDLFSPVKQQPSPQRKATRSRNRPRLRSSTFVNKTNETTPSTSPTKLSVSSFTSDATVQNAFKSREHNQPENSPCGSPRSSQGLSQPRNSKQYSSTSKDDKLNKADPFRPLIRPRKAPRRLSCKRMPGAYLSSSSSLTTEATSSSATSANGKILADLRRLEQTNGAGVAAKNRGLALFAPYINPRPSPASQTKLDGEGKVTTAPSDASKSHVPTEDIWLTSDEENVASGSKHHHHHRSSHKRLSTHRASSRPAAQGADYPKSHYEHLEPGAAETPVGPVDVKDYFPRRSSLRQRPANMPSLSPRDDIFPDKDSASCEEIQHVCECSSLRAEVASLKSDMAALRREVAAMKRSLPV